MEIEESTIQQLYSRIAALETRLKAVEAGGGQFETQSPDAEEPAAGSDDVIIPDIVVEPGAMENNKFLFPLTIEKDDESGLKTATIGAGAVQIGGYTYFVGEQQITGLYEDFYLCAVVNLPNGSVSMEQMESEEQIRQEQDDMDRFIVPLYKVSDGSVEIDYRPMPFAGTWEVYPEE